MAIKTRLKDQEIQDLLNYYKSELRKLKVITGNIRDKIKELESYRTTAKEETKAKPARRPGRPPKPAKQTRKPYPLSAWDNIILGSIRKAGKVQVNQEIFENLKSGAQKEGIYKDDTHTRVKLNQCLVKLANRREDLKKVKFKGRGYGYALSEWLDERKRLRKEFKR